MAGTVFHGEKMILSMSPDTGEVRRHHPTQVKWWGRTNYVVKASKVDVANGINVFLFTLIHVDQNTGLITLVRMSNTVLELLETVEECLSEVED
jgi:hypothetical protein